MPARSRRGSTSRLLGYLSAWNRGSVEVECTWNEYPRGTNIAFRREAFERFGAFDPELGRAGGSLLSGEEIELCLRIERGGGKIVYVPQSRVRHAVGAERLTPDWMLARVEAGGYGQAIIEWRHHGWLGLARGLARHGRNALSSVRATGGRQSDALFARCQRRGLVGYSIGAARAVRTLARYSPPTP